MIEINLNQFMAAARLYLFGLAPPAPALVRIPVTPHQVR